MAMVSILGLYNYDESIFDVVDCEKEILEELVKRNMENCVSLSVPFKVSADYGTDWYDCKQEVLKLKEVKSFIIAEVIICILKVLGGVLNEDQFKRN